MVLRCFVPIILAITVASVAHAQHRPANLLTVQRSEVTFVSDAPLERIAATCRGATGVLDKYQRSFAVRIPLRLFEGFNSPLQREHFHENYVESGVHPNALFEGRIIEAVDLDSIATYAVRAKGTFTLHGVKKERIVECALEVTKEGIRVDGTFEVALADHGIRIPRVVQGKLAPLVKVDVGLMFKKTAPKP